MKVALLTVNDAAAAGGQPDLSGPFLHKKVAEAGWTVVRADVVRADREAISRWLCKSVDDQKVDLVLTLGGVGLGPRDLTPEATRDVIDREAPGIPEAIRAASMSKTPDAMLSRAVAGVRGTALIINLSGSPRVVTDQWATLEPVIERAVASVQDAAPERPPPDEGLSLPRPQTSPQGTFLGHVSRDLPEKK